MRDKVFERKMRGYESFHGLRATPDAWTVVRVDGRSFAKLTKARCAKPFDSMFHGIMIHTAQALLEMLGGEYAHTQSDEVSILLKRKHDLFDREVEKLVSTSASIATGAFCLAVGEMVNFDSRVVVLPSADDVVDYFRWRQSDAINGCLNGWAYWTLRDEGHSAYQASKQLHGKGDSAKRELLTDRGISIDTLPLWQRHGTGLYFEKYERLGWNHKEGMPAIAIRRGVRINSEIPVRSEYADFLGRFIV